MAPPRKPPAQVSPEGARELQALALQFGPALRRYFQKKVGAADADDLVQEVFLSLQIRGADADIENIEGYLFRVAANAVIQHNRRPGWDWASHLDLDDLDAMADDVSPERVLLGKEAVEKVVAALDDLPPRAAQAFFLHRFEEMTYTAIAARMKITNSSVERLMKRALKRLGKALETRP
jgi:RNA polymerase sigma factor (sigma-70 family)